MSERQLAAKLRKGNVSVLDEIIDRYSPYLCAIAYNILGEKLGAEDIEEIVSDSFTALWYNREKIEQGGLKSYLAALTRNAAIDRLRALHITMPLEEDIVAAECSDPEAEALKKSFHWPRGMQLIHSRSRTVRYSGVIISCTRRLKK